jgi:Mlc titration factor MtfA (ptsG expression regulator)
MLQRLFAGTNPAIDDPAWQRLRAQSPLLRTFAGDDAARLRERADAFLRAKGIDAAGGAVVGDHERQLIATLAAIPILQLGVDWYDGWHAVIVYPDEFVATHAFEDEDGVVHEGERELVGESWDRGPMILSLRDVLDCASGELIGNVVIHECAHKLDQLNGTVNGFPPLHRGMSTDAWTAAWQQAYDDLVRRVDAGEETAIDPYAVEEPGEFFAVLSEYFFTEALLVLDEYPAVYEQLRSFYRQDPAARPLPEYPTLPSSA